MGVLDDLIGEARARVEKPETVDVKVPSGGRLVTVTFTKLLGADWALLTATHPPREGARLDGNLGFNIDGAAADYPADRIRVEGEVPTAEQWRAWFGLLDAPHRQNIATALWTMNQFAPASELGSVGKASRAGSRKKQR